MNIPETFLYAAIIAFCYFTILFVVATIIKDNSILDIAWGPSFIVTAWLVLLINAIAGPEDVVIGARQYLVAALVTVWGLRLGIRIFRRNQGRGEDPRYVKFREEWGKYFVLRSFFQIFILQGVLLLVISLPVVRAITAPDAPFGIMDLLGAAIWLMGFLFEAVADWQLLQFKKVPDSKGRIIMTGLWQYSRHPNYFGEVTLWWGIYLIALAVPGGWMTVIGPMTITALILGVSGIPMLEKKYEGNREFDEYKRRTSAFFPLPPKS